MSLSELKPGKIAVVNSILGGRHLRQKLVNLGMIPGSENLCSPRKQKRTDGSECPGVTDYDWSQDGNKNLCHSKMIIQ